MFFSRSSFWPFDCNLKFQLISIFATVFCAHVFAIGDPKFAEPIKNATVHIGRDVVLTCTIDNLSIYKVAWLQVDTQTILAIHHHIVSKNNRIKVSHIENRNWNLHLKSVRESDRGWYMCQVNTDPMLSQVGFLQVVVPPDILDYPTSTDVVAYEGSTIAIRCSARGYPEPVITWKRENRKPIDLGDGFPLLIIEGSLINFTRIHKENMGIYLCIASNGIPPTVSKRISVNVNFAPKVWIQKQLIGAKLNSDVLVKCHSEAFPKSINYWMFDDDRILSPNAKYAINITQNSFETNMTLVVRKINMHDFGDYKCVSRNLYGEANENIRIYQLNVKNISTDDRDSFEKLEQSTNRCARNNCISYYFHGIMIIIPFFSQFLAKSRVLLTYYSNQS